MEKEVGSKLPKTWTSRGGETFPGNFIVGEKSVLPSQSQERINTPSLLVLAFRREMTLVLLSCGKCCGLGDL